MYVALSLTENNPLQANIRKLISNVNKKFRHANCLTLHLTEGVQKKELADSLAPNKFQVSSRGPFGYAQGRSLRRGAGDVLILCRGMKLGIRLVNPVS